VIPYAQREVFTPLTLDLLQHAEMFIARVSSQWGNELRCHELARAAFLVLVQISAYKMRVVDGVVGIVDHSWIEIAANDRYDRNRSRMVILDVYCPGRLPQVQLVDSFVFLRPTYEEREPRGDIREEIVQRLVKQMRP
jgi:hypothetical protein